MRALAPALAVTVMLAGTAACSSASGSPAAGQSPAPAAPPADGGTFASADALLGALAAAGVSCASPSPVANPSQRGATSLVDCTARSSQDTAIGTFDSHADALAAAERLASSGMLDSGTYVLVGGNWLLNSSSYSYGVSVWAKLGGTVIPVPSSS